MKRRAVSFITSLALCLGLCSTWALAATSEKITKTGDTQNGPALTITHPTVFDGGGYTYTVPNKTAFSVESGGSLTIINGTIKSGSDAGVEVKSGGSLTVSDSNVTVIGATIGLDISSGASVELSGGTFKASNVKGVAILADDYASLLATGYAFFDESGEPIPLTDVGAKNMVSVQTCADHVYDVYTPTSGAPTHDWTCLACGTKGTTPCSFRFNENGEGACADCGHTLEITIVPNSAVYDGALKPDTDPVKVMLDGTTRLTKGDHYTVDYTARADVGEVVITVDGKIYTGDWTYTAVFSVTKAQPVITWNTVPEPLYYNGAQVDRTVVLPWVTITGVPAKDMDALKNSIQFSYREYKEGEEGSDAGFTDGLPTDAGTYEIRASLPEQKNYEAAETQTYLKLTIKKINPIIEAPKAIDLVYNRTPQELVTPGTVRDGAKILFATSEDGTYSETIPTGTNADTDYKVWYKVEGTNNYESVGPKEVEGVEIQRKPVTPDVKLQYTSTVYDGGKKQPTVTVTDTTDNNYVLPTTEYTVTYTNNKNVGTATVTVTDSGSGNYIVSEVKCTFQITAADQNTLTITDQPDVVCYGDTFTLGTVGGSGSGTVTWKIISATDAAGKPTDVAEIGEDSGQVTVKGLGSFTVQATKAGETNHEDTIAKATFRVDPKRVVAVVTAANKIYDDTDTATVTAKVAEQDIVPGDTITIVMPTGSKFSDANAGTNKSVTVNASGAEIKVNEEIISNGAEDKKYIVIIPTTPVRADITRAATSITVKTEDDDGAELKLENSRDYDGTTKALLFDNVLSASTETNVDVTIEYALSESGSYSTVIPKATNAGSYEVWYRVRETANYFGTAAEKVTVIISPKQVTADVTLEKDSYVYDGSEKKPAVTVRETDANGNEIPSTEYTVAYSNNVNVGKNAAVTVTARENGNYEFATVQKNFEITTGDKQAELTSSPLARNLTYNGQKQELVTVGTATGGYLVYALASGYEADGTPIPPKNEIDYTTEIPKGIDAGEYTVYYKVKGNGNYEDSDVYQVSVTIQPKTVTSPEIELPNETFTYDGNEKMFSGTITVKDGGVTISNDEYTVTYSNNINAGTATIHIVDNNGGNYNVSGSKTFTIEKATASFATEPQSVVSEGQTLTYSGKALTLIKAGVANGGTAVYALDDENGPYFETLPTGTVAGDYKVYAKVRGDANHVDSEVKEISVTIAPKSVDNPTVTCSPGTFPYDGTEKTPNIIVTDGDNEIPAREYTVTFDPQQRIAVGTYKVTVTAKSGGNYTFTATGQFNIVEASQAPLSIVTDMASTVHYGDTFRLSAVGGSGSGAVQWSVENTDTNAEETAAAIATITQDGVVTVKGVGTFTVTAYREGADDSYKQSNTDSIAFTAVAKPVTAVVTAENKEYDGKRDATLTVTVPVTGITITVDDVKGTFDSADVGTNKTVTIDSSKATATGNENNYYDITYPATTTASITPAPTSLNGISVTKKENLTYSGIPQELIDVTDTAAELGGNLAYSLNGVSYDLNIPTATNAGTYTVRYKVLADSNHKDSEVASVTVTIGKATPTIDSTNLTATPITSGQSLKDSVLSGGKATFAGVKVPGTFTWTDKGDTPLTESGQHNVTFTPADKVNFEPVTEIQVRVEVTSVPEPEPEESEVPETPGSNTNTQPGTESPSTQTTVRDGTASTVVSDAASDELVNEAVANQSENVVIKPEITGDVTKTEVSIPASAVSRLSSETDAALTVSTPVADVTIPNKSLETLSGAGGTVSVVTEQVDNTVVLTLTVGGKDVGNIPGGLTLTVSVEDIVPGTVAVLVYEDGTRETVRRSVAEDGGVRIPLNGSATVEIVDNSKEFADVPAESWAADAVAFTSAHELFNGTGEATFSPELSMNRAMLATVLYNLEDCPDQELTEEFSDVSSSAWYAASVSWAASNGVVGGYGDGQFGPDTDITREQIAVMLWRYAGSPATDEQSLNFTDAGQASSYALEALYWAAANGIMNGHGDGRLDPGGLATRAQAAQMLKNFMENT